MNRVRDLLARVDASVVGLALVAVGAAVEIGAGWAAIITGLAAFIASEVAG